MHPPPRSLVRYRALRCLSASERVLPHKGGGGASGKRSPRPRDYYRVEDEDGHRYWMFREGLYQESEHGVPSWYLHGVFG